MGERGHAPEMHVRSGTSGTDESGQLRHEIAKSRPRKFDQQCQREQRNQQRKKAHLASGEETSQTEAQKARDQNKVLEIGEDADFGRNPADHQQLQKQGEEAHQSQLPVRKSPQGGWGEFPSLRPTPTRTSHFAVRFCAAQTEEINIRQRSYEDDHHKRGTQTE